MLGNDIVDLTDPEAASGAQHPRFDQRVFANRELASLAASPEPTRVRWMLWAVKESAFKGLRASRPETVLSPVQFVVDLGSRLQGTVSYRGEQYCATVEMNRDCVHAIVSDDLTRPGTLWGSRRVEDCNVAETASQQARSLALERISARLGIDSSELGIERVGRVPHLVYRDARTLATLSLSHHGSYVSFACQLAPPSVAVADRLNPRRRVLERATH
jgi:phosphopantetheinyl transferase (holo-ACP synthase)